MRWKIHARNEFWIPYPADADLEDPCPKVDVADFLAGTSKTPLSGKIVILCDPVTDHAKLTVDSKRSVIGPYSHVFNIRAALTPESSRVEKVSTRLDWIYASLLAACTALGMISRGRLRWMAPSAAVAALVLPWVIAKLGGPIFDVVTPLTGVILASATALFGKRFIHESPGATLTGASVILDIVGSTDLLRDLGADRFRQLHEDINRRWHHLVNQRNGRIERTTGDGGLAIFLANDGADYVDRALESTERLINELHEVSEKHGVKVAVTCGIEAGILSGGYVWEGGHKAWSSSGIPINKSKRLQSFCKETGVPIHVGPTAAELLVHGRVEKIAIMEAAGFTDPIDVYAPASKQFRD
jgi:class 3 adenylate cyclase